MQINTKELLREIPTNAMGAIDYRKLEKVLKQHPELRSHIVDKIVPIIAKPDGHKLKTVVAVNYVWEAEEMARLLAEKGIKVGVAVNHIAANRIHSDEIPAKDAIERYKLHEDDPDAIQVLISPYVASEGFDAPFTEALVWASPTDSDLRYTQYTGRLARRAPGKKFGVVIDCLYQTSQYGWSYNMGMWMKGNVSQLDNGMLYMGPESDISEISQSQVFADAQAASDTTSLEDLMKQARLEQIEDDALALTQKRLPRFYVGTGNALLTAAMAVHEELMASNPELFEPGLSGSQTVIQVTDAGRELFDAAMLARGFEVRTLQQLQDTDFSLAQRGHFDKTFVEDASRGRGRAFIDQVRREHPDWIESRIRGGRTIDVIPQHYRKEFLEYARGHGMREQEKDIQPIQAADLPLSREVARRLFRGSKVAAVLDEVTDELKARYPEWFYRGRTTPRSRVIDIIREEGIDTLIAEMAARRIQLKQAA